MPFPISFVMLGKTGLILLVIKTGIDTGLTTDATAAVVDVPIVSVLGFLVEGGTLTILVLPYQPW